MSLADGTKDAAAALSSVLAGVRDYTADLLSPPPTWADMFTRWHTGPADALPAPGQVGFFTTSGVFVAVLPVTADDADAVKAFLQHGLSDESRRRRFLTSVPQVRTRVAASLSRRDGHTRVALAGWAGDGADARIVGIAEYATAPGEAEPEVAVAVADDYQGQAVGTQLLTMLATLSLAGGHTTWTAEVLADNTAVLGLLRRVGHVAAAPASRGERHVTVTLDAARILTGQP